MYGALKTRGIKYSNVETLLLFALLSQFLTTRLDVADLDQRSHASFRNHIKYSLQTIKYSKTTFNEQSSFITF